ncbi:carboxylating nicotinate-nucleotide diphosphorylase [Thiosocius teredinicola]|uniref:carboxylating nicotinate-nucleotide diphosphorylase n=1 Tax=Thiosocius teredinicola TaxID=1973002 RepID=UPI000990DC52
MTSPARNPEQAAIDVQVRQALDEDLGSGDLTAALMPQDALAVADVVAREDAVLCGVEWFNSVFRQLDATLSIQWFAGDSDRLQKDQVVCRIEGPARPILSGERTALNFLQTLSGTASAAARYVAAVEGTSAVILDTRKTIPGLRQAQKYAVVCGGASNHRVGLYDAVLIKENHIRAAGSIAAAMVAAQANTADGTMIEVEVENLDELEQALKAGARRILLDNFDNAALIEAVKRTDGRAELEASGGVNLDTVLDIALTGVDYISVGQLTKDVRATDFSMLFATS